MVNPYFMFEHQSINNIEHDIYIDNHSVPPLMSGKPVKADYSGAPIRSAPLSPFSGNPCLASNSLVNKSFAGPSHVLGPVQKHLGPCVFVYGVLVPH